MIACIISTLMSRHLKEESVYTLKLARRGVNIRAGKEINVLKSIPVSDVMTHAVETIPEGLPLAVMAEIISKSKYNSFPMVNELGHLIGILSYVDYGEVIFDEDLKDLVVASDLWSCV